MEEKGKEELTTREKIEFACDSLKDFLIEKNKRYGNSALEPIRVFSSTDSEEQIKIRMDDKLSRIRNSKEDRENDYLDLVGYLILFMVKKNWIQFSKFLD